MSIMTIYSSILKWTGMFLNGYQALFESVILMFHDTETSVHLGIIPLHTSQWREQKKEQVIYRGSSFSNREYMSSFVLL